LIFVAQATRMDTLWSVADALDVDAIELLANNSGIIDSPTVTLAGTTISVCSVGEFWKDSRLVGTSAVLYTERRVAAWHVDIPLPDQGCKSHQLATYGLFAMAKLMRCAVCMAYVVSNEFTAPLEQLLAGVVLFSPTMQLSTWVSPCCHLHFLDVRSKQQVRPAQVGVYTSACCRRGTCAEAGAGAKARTCA
jgi:hypothetical protein